MEEQSFQKDNQFIGIFQSQIGFKKKKLIGISELLENAFRIFKERIVTLLAIFGTRITITILFVIFLFITSTILVIIFTPLLSKTLGIGSFILIFIIILLALAFIESWMDAALISAIGENKNFYASIKSGLKKTISFTWVSLLMVIILTGGVALFFLPSIIFFVWFSFATYAVVLDGKRGISALSFSKQLVSGSWWKVFFRILFLFIFPFLLILFLALLFAFSLFIQTLPSSLSFIVSLLLNIILVLILIFSPFFLINFPIIYMTLIYLDLKKVKGF